MKARVNVFKSNTKDYHHAFQTFLDHTDQKQQAKQWMEQFIHTLPSKKIFVDAGAGNGKVTAWFTPSFEKTVALEPNPSLYEELKTVCPEAETYPAAILDAKLKVAADFVLASHVFYYIPKNDWMKNLTRLSSWLAPTGALVVMIQNSRTDCMNMLRHFFNQSFDLNPLMEDFKKQYNDQFSISMETVSSAVNTTDFKAAYTVAEFMMNLLPMPEPPLRADLEAYVEKNFAVGDGQYRLSCHQDFLKIRLRA